MFGKHLLWVKAICHNNVLCFLLSSLKIVLKKSPVYINFIVSKVIASFQILRYDLNRTIIIAKRVQICKNRYRSHWTLLVAGQNAKFAINIEFVFRCDRTKICQFGIWVTLGNFNRRSNLENYPLLILNTFLLELSSYLLDNSSD